MSIELTEFRVMYEAKNREDALKHLPDARFFEWADGYDCTRSGDGDAGFLDLDSAERYARGAAERLPAVWTVVIQTRMNGQWFTYGRMKRTAVKPRGVEA